jgi:hypothetical protein
MVQLLVRGQENGIPRVGLLQAFLIRNAGRQLRHVEDLMAVLS